jgi:hypothetical protein
MERFPPGKVRILLAEMEALKMLMRVIFLIAASAGRVIGILKYPSAMVESWLRPGGWAPETPEGKPQPRSS